MSGDGDGDGEEGVSEGAEPSTGVFLSALIVLGKHAKPYFPSQRSQPAQPARAAFFNYPLEDAK